MTYRIGIGFLPTVAIVLLATGVGARASSIIVLPNANTNTIGNALTEAILGDGLPVQFEWQIAASDLTGAVDSSITSIGFRLTANAATQSAAISIPNWDLELGKGTTPIGALGNNLATNISGAVTVYNAALNIPTGSFVGGNPVNPFYFINFTTPFTYTGGDLIFYLQQSGTASLYVDGHTPGSDGDTAGSGGGSAVFTEVYYYPITALQFTSLPEPGTWQLAAIGLALAWIALRRRTRATFSQ